MWQTIWTYDYGGSEEEEGGDYEEIELEVIFGTDAIV